MFNRKGQSTVEYALVIAVVVAGLLLMQHYVKRGYAGRLKSAADEMGEQYDPTAYSATFNINRQSNVTQTVQNTVTSTTHREDELNIKTGNESVNAWTADEDLYNR
ncbi:MAG: hypothetical protein HY350_02755 [Candidatus Omnitrophica bacterium]|nr:hypothetical protein [Candidatus Omnitrophota bacterium]